MSGLVGWLWALPLFMLWFVPAQWVRTKERQYARAMERSGGDPDQVNDWLLLDDMGRGFWLSVIAGWAVVGGTATWAAAYFVRNSPQIIAIVLGLFLVGTAWNTGWRNIEALMRLRRARTRLEPEATKPPR